MIKDISSRLPFTEEECAKAVDAAGIDFYKQASNANCYYYSRHEINSANEVIEYLQDKLFTSSQITKSFETSKNYETWIIQATYRIGKWLESVKYKKVSGYSKALEDLGFTSKIINDAMKEMKSEFKKYIDDGKIVDDVDL